MIRKERVSKKCQRSNSYEEEQEEGGGGSGGGGRNPMENLSMVSNVCLLYWVNEAYNGKSMEYM